MSTVLLTPIDYGMLAVMLVISMGIGLYFALRGGGQRSPHDYLLAGGNLSFWPVCLSLFATFQSAVGLLGVTADVYVYGSMIIYYGVAMALSNLVSAFTVVPLFHPLRLTSVYQYLQMRYHSTVLRYVGVFVGMIVTTLYMSFVLLSPALAIKVVTDIPVSWTVILVASVGTVYTTIGGMKSVVWTDVFQTVVMLGGLLVVMIKGTLEVGGSKEVFDISISGDRLVLGEWSFDPRVRHTLWGFLIGHSWHSMSYNLQQSAVQRISSTKNEKHAKLVFLAALPLNIGYAIMLSVSGLIAYAYFVHKGCDPIANGDVSNSNQIIVYFVVRVLGFLPGLPGLFLATILSGSLSTLSSGLNSLAANTVEDVLRKPLSKMSSNRVTTITKIIVMLYGCLFTGLAYMMRSLKGPVTQIASMTFGACAGSLFGVFILGAVFPQANKVGAMTGFAVSAALSLWISLGAFLSGTPAIRKPPGPVYACPVRNGTSAFSAMDTFISSDNVTSGLLSSPWDDVISTSTEPMITPEEAGSFRIYDISYLWYSMITSTITIVVGVVVSYITKCFTDQYPAAPAHLLLPQVRRFLGMQGHQRPPGKQCEMTYLQKDIIVYNEECESVTAPSVEKKTLA